MEASAPLFGFCLLNQPASSTSAKVADPIEPYGLRSSVSAKVGWEPKPSLDN